MENDSTFIAEVYNPDPKVWEKIKADILEMEHEAFGDKAFTDEEMEGDFLNKKNTIVILKCNDKVIGFSYARSLDEADEPGRESEINETVYLWNTVIANKYRGRHLVGKLAETLEDELRRKGYSYMESYAVVKNNFAANIAKHYGDRVVKSEPKETGYGRQMYFRIRL